MRTEITERILGDWVTVAVDLAALEAIAQEEDDLMVVSARLQRHSYRMTRVCLRAMLRSGGMAQPDAWLDRAFVEAPVSELAALAFRAMSDALTKAESAAKKAAATVKADPAPAAESEAGTPAS